jgi:hypothetical protein
MPKYIYPDRIIEYRFGLKGKNKQTWESLIKLRVKLASSYSMGSKKCIVKLKDGS